jgi:hypothetical protein
MKLPSFPRAAVLILLLLAPAVSPGAVVIDNFGSGNQGFANSLSGPTAVGFFGNPFADRQVAFSFTTGPEEVWMTKLEFTVNITSNASPIQFELSTGSSVPGGVDPVVIGSVAPASTVPISQTLSISPSGGVHLEASTLYWIHLTVPSGSGNYTFSNNNVPVVEPGWSLGNTWSRIGTNGTWSELSSGPQARIRMTVVPEPGAALLGSAGLLLVLRRRR